MPAFRFRVSSDGNAIIASMITGKLTYRVLVYCDEKTKHAHNDNRIAPFRPFCCDIVHYCAMTLHLWSASKVGTPCVAWCVVSFSDDLTRASPAP
jgi:hypothetical protein